MISLNIKNRLFTLFAKTVNIFDFNFKRLNITILTIIKIVFI